MPYDVSTAILSQMLAYLSSKGVEPLKLFERAGIDPAILDDPDARLDVASYNLMEDAAAELSRDPLFALHMGEFSDPQTWSLPGAMMLHCRNLGEAFAKAAEYQAIIGTVLRTRMKLRGLRAVVLLEPHPGAPELSRHCAESAFSAMVAMMRTLAGRDIRPLEVRFSAESPAGPLEEYERVFCCPVSFGAGENSVALDISTGRIRVPEAKPELLSFLEKQAAAILETLEKRGPLSDKVRYILAAHLPARKYSVAFVAR